MIDFHGKTVWITGASSGIGKALAIKLSSLGANLVLTSRKEDQLLKVAKLCKNECFILTLDLEKTMTFN